MRQAAESENGTSCAVDNGRISETALALNAC